MAMSTVAGSSLAKHLASCNKSIRDKAIRLLKSWLPSRTEVSDDEMKKIWKGLFYCVWHADKQQVQLELINRLSSLLVNLDLSLSIQYFEIFLLTIRREWGGIDYLRLDKFYLLIRRFLHHLFLLFKKNSWDLVLVGRLMGVLEEKTLLSVDRFPAQGVNYHLAEIFLEELKPFLPLSLEIVEVLLKPFISVLGKSLDKVLLTKIKSRLFGSLLENGKKLLERKKLGEEAKDEVELFGTIALTLGLSKRFFELGSSTDCVQGNRKVLFSLHEEAVKLERDLANSAVEILPPRMINGGDEDMVLADRGEEVPNGLMEKRSKKIKKAKKAEVPVEMVETDEGEEVGNGSKEKRSKKIKKAKKAEVLIECVEEPQFNNGSADKEVKKIKKAKKAEVSIECVEEPQINNGSTDKDVKKIKKAKTASAGSGSEAKKSKKRRNSPLSSDVLDGGNGNMSNGESLTNEGGLINFDESVISNLQMQFEKIAAEVGMGTDGASSIDSPVSLSLGALPKKRKRAKNIDAQVSLSDGLFGDDVIGGSAGGKSVEKSAKKVRFSMKNNVVWKPHSPLPPQSLRLPPSATPRGSALKKGIPAGPVIGSPMGRKFKQRTSPLKKARKNLKTVSPAVKRLKKLRSYSA